jgi:hypothetical protein
MDARRERLSDSRPLGRQRRQAVNSRPAGKQWLWPTIDALSIRVNHAAQ